jgi:nucleoside-diphosphate-sugar epimerase
LNILLTGHRGFIGSALLKRLEVDHDVDGLDLKDGDDLLTVEFVKDYDLIIHLAGRSGVRESAQDPAAYWNHNVEASRRLFDRYKNTRILYASSSSAYEPDLNPYAASKFCLDQLAARYPGTLGMRFHTVYSDVPRPGMFFDKLLNGTLEYVTRHKRDFVHLDDVCSAIDLLVQTPALTGTVDIGTGTAVSVQELAPHLPIRLYTPGERNITCANTELMNSLGWMPVHNIKKFLTNNNLHTIISHNKETI